MPAIRCICNRFAKRKPDNDGYECKCGNMYDFTPGEKGEEEYSYNDGVYIIAENKLQLKPTKEETKMSFFQFDPKQAGNAGFDPVPAGEYEVIISEAKVDTFRSGNRGIKVTLTIRDDVAQEGGKRKVFDNFVEVPEAAFKFHNLAAGLQWGEGDGAATIEDFANKIRYASVRAKFKVTAATRDYAAKNEVVTYLPSQAAAHSGGGGQQDPFYNDGKPIDISDDELPF